MHITGTAIVTNPNFTVYFGGKPKSVFCCCGIQLNSKEGLELGVGNSSITAMLGVESFGRIYQAPAFLRLRTTELKR